MDYCKAHPLDYGDAESLLDVLYWNYAENNLLDNPKIKDGFATLRTQFLHLSMHEFDPVFNTVSELCLEYERAGFEEGGKNWHLSCTGNWLDKVKTELLCSVLFFTTKRKGEL